MARRAAAFGLRRQNGSGAPAAQEEDCGRRGAVRNAGLRGGSCGDDRSCKENPEDDCASELRRTAYKSTRREGGRRTKRIPPSSCALRANRTALVAAGPKAVGNASICPPRGGGLAAGPYLGHPAIPDAFHRVPADPLKFGCFRLTTLFNFFVRGRDFQPPQVQVPYMILCCPPPQVQVHTPLPPRPPTAPREGVTFHRMTDSGLGRSHEERRWLFEEPTQSRISPSI